MHNQLFAIIAKQYQRSYKYELCLGIWSLNERRSAVMVMQTRKMKRTSHAVDKTTDLNFMKQALQI